MTFDLEEAELELGLSERMAAAGLTVEEQQAVEEALGPGAAARPAGAALHRGGVRPA